MKKNQIKGIRIERVYDESAYTDDIGKYTDKKSDWTICRRCGEFIFNAEKENKRQDEIDEEIYHIEMEGEETSAENLDKLAELQKERESLELHSCPKYHRELSYFLPYAGGEEEGSEDYQKYGKQDFERMEGLNNGDWNFIGIIAKAEIVTSNDTLQTIRSGGLWGIESDAGDYLEEVGKEELANLRSELMALGFGKRAIDYAFKNIETIDK